jgi:hypothetical protein
VFVLLVFVELRCCLRGLGAPAGALINDPNRVQVAQQQTTFLYLEQSNFVMVQRQEKGRRIPVRPYRYV